VRGRRGREGKSETNRNILLRILKNKYFVHILKRKDNM
jgi:hypothetical protein